MTDYDKLRELAENATPGPWRTDDRLGDPERNLVAPNGEYIASDFEDYRGVIHRTEDAEYIAAVHPDTVLALLGEIQRAKADAWDEGMNAAFQSFLRPLKDDCTRDVDTNPYREETR